MDRIYSRRRIPKIKFLKFKNKKAKRICRLIVILMIAIITTYFIAGAIDPIFEALCGQKAISVAIDTMDKETTNILSKYDYSKLISVEKSETDNTNIVSTDVETLNKIVLDLSVNLNEKFKNLEREQIGIPIGAFTGSKYVSGIGPKLKIKIVPSGNVVTEVKTEFESKGINQTIYRIYLETKSRINVLTPYKKISREVESKVLLVETLVVGDVPNTYLNLDKK